MFRNLPDITQLVVAERGPCGNQCLWFLHWSVPLCSRASHFSTEWPKGQLSGCSHSCWSVPQCNRHWEAQAARAAGDVLAEGRLGRGPVICTPFSRGKPQEGQSAVAEGAFIYMWGDSKEGDWSGNRSIRRQRDQVTPQSCNPQGP